MCRVIRPKQSEEEEEFKLKYIRGGLMKTPEISVLQAQKEIAVFGERMMRMSGMVKALYRTADDAEFEGAVAVPGQGAVSNLTVTSGAGTLGSLKVDGTVSVPAGKPNEGGGTIPVGGIVAWWQEDIPDGWVLCDGNNGTPDLRGWFVVGANDDDSLWNTGGAASVTLTEKQIPPHTHGYVFPSGEGQGSVLGTDDDGHIWRHEKTDAVTGSEGGGQAHENRPPYLALYYIMRAR